MACYKSEHTSFDIGEKVHPWNKLVYHLCEEIPPDVIERLIYLARQQLGEKFGVVLKESVCKCQSFFYALQDKFEEDTPDVVMRLFQCIDLHDQDSGSYRYADCIQKYKESKSRNDTENSALRNDDFIGRKDLVSKVTEYFLRDKQVKGVILCGMSGIGKTAVANEVAWRLKCKRPQWKIIRLSEVEKSDIKDLYKNLIFTLLEAFESDLKVKVEDELMSLKKNLHYVFLAVLKESIPNACTLIYIDNVDDHCLDRQQRRDFENFLREMDQLISKSSMKVCLLFTVQRKIFGDLDPGQDECTWASGTFVQLEVKPMNNADAGDVLKKHSRIELTEEQCSRINTSVGGNPMALIQVAYNLPFVESFYNGIEGLLSNLLDPNTVLYDQLEQAIARLDPQCSDIEVLINLSLFKTAWFSFDEAAHVGLKELDKDSYVHKFNKKHERNTRTILSLLSLKNQHLIEIDKLSADTDSEEKSKAMQFTKYGYCLHPLIYKHIHQKYDENVTEKDCAKKTSLEKARLKFMQYYCKKIDQLGEFYNTKPHEAQALLEKSKVHLKSFYEYFLNGTFTIDELMTDSENKRKDLSLLDCKRSSLWKMLDYVQTAETKIEFARKLSREAENDHNVYVYVYWRCKEVEFLLSAGKTRLGFKEFTDLSNRLGVASDDIDKGNKTLLEQQSPWRLEKEERCPMLAVFYETEARKLKEEDKKNTRIVDCLEKAKIMYKKSQKENSSKKIYKSLRQVDIARVVNAIGNFYFLNCDLEKSRMFHEEALCILQEYKHGCQINMDDFKEFKHPSSSEYLTNIAACEHELGRRATDPDKKKDLLEAANKKYTFCIEYDKTMKRDFLQSHATTRMNRAEIHNLLKDLDSAIEDSTKALKIFKESYSMPNATKTLSYAQVGYFNYKKGKKSKNPGERKEFLRRSVDLYDDALFEITRGGLPLDHKEFKDIKDFHKKAMEAAGMSESDVQQRIRKYSDFVLGKYDKIINKIKQTEPGRSIQTVLQECGAQGAVGVVMPGTYVDPCPDNVGDNQDNVDSSSDKEDESADSSKSSSDCELFGDDIDEIIARKINRQRRDSGVEDEEIDIDQDHSDGSKQHGGDLETGPGSSATEVTYAHEKLAQTSKRSLKRQESIDIDSQFDVDPGQSSSMIGTHPGDVVELVEEQRRKRRRSSQDTGIGDGSRLSSSTNRSSLSSIGSQDSVTSLLGRRLVLQSELSQHQEDEITDMEAKTDG